MGVYIVSWGLTRETEDDESWEFQSLLLVVKDAFGKQEAAKAVCSSFKNTPQAAEGWELTGPPSVLHVDGAIFTDWEDYIDPPAANTTAKPPYLTPVE